MQYGVLSNYCINIHLHPHIHTHTLTPSQVGGVSGPGEGLLGSGGDHALTTQHSGCGRAQWWAVRCRWFRWNQWTRLSGEVQLRCVADSVRILGYLVKTQVLIISTCIIICSYLRLVHTVQCMCIKIIYMCTKLCIATHAVTFSNQSWYNYY